MDSDLPKTRQEYDAIMDQTLQNPLSDKYFMGMTYKYHADALRYPQPDYAKISTPFLVVAGAKDTIIGSSDEFVRKAKVAGAPITYLRIPDMDHYIRKRPEVVQQSFTWLKQFVK
jgi:acetyl esterase/lipase